MSKHIVYQRRNILAPYPVDGEAISIANFPRGWRKVAEVECATVEDAYRLTNHTDHLWPDKPGVRALYSSVRSTSVGDIVRTPEGRYMFVLPIGFCELKPKGKKMPFTLRGRATRSA